MVGGALAQQGYTPVLCTLTAGGVTEAAYVDLLFEQQVSGVVFAGGQYAQAAAPHGHYAKLAERVCRSSWSTLGSTRCSSRGSPATTSWPPSGGRST